MLSGERIDDPKADVVAGVRVLRPGIAKAHHQPLGDRQAGHGLAGASPEAEALRDAPRQLDQAPQRGQAPQPG
jgi:hypothetical protein